MTREEAGCKVIVRGTKVISNGKNGWIKGHMAVTLNKLHGWFVVLLLLVLLTRMTWVQLRSDRPVMTGEGIYTVYAFSRRPDTSCSIPYPSGFKGMPLMVGQSERWVRFLSVDPYLGDLLRWMCGHRQNDVNLSEIVRLQQYASIWMVFMMILTLRLVTRKWWVALCVGSALLSRGELVAEALKITSITWSLSLQWTAFAFMWLGVRNLHYTAYIGWVFSLFLAAYVDPDSLFLTFLPLVFLLSRSKEDESPLPRIRWWKSQDTALMTSSFFKKKMVLFSCLGFLFWCLGYGLRLFKKLETQWNYQVKPPEWVEVKGALFLIGDVLLKMPLTFNMSFNRNGEWDYFFWAGVCVALMMPLFLAFKKTRILPETLRIFWLMFFVTALWYTPFLVLKFEGFFQVASAIWPEGAPYLKKPQLRLLEPWLLALSTASFVWIVQECVFKRWMDRYRLKGLRHEERDQRVF